MKRATIRIMAAAALGAGLGLLLIPNGPQLLIAIATHSDPALTQSMTVGAAIAFVSMVTLMFTAEPQGEAEPPEPG
jgi:hypothetical protein